MDDAPNAWHIVDVERFDVTTVRSVMRQIEVSDGIDQLAYRETEIDSLWSIVHMAVRDGKPGAQEVLDLLWIAHDAVGLGAGEEALAALKSLCEVPDLERFNG